MNYATGEVPGYVATRPPRPLQLFPSQSHLVVTGTTEPGGGAHQSPQAVRHSWRLNQTQILLNPGKATMLLATSKPKKHICVCRNAAWLVLYSPSACPPARLCKGGLASALPRRTARPMFRGRIRYSSGALARILPCCSNKHCWIASTSVSGSSALLTNMAVGGRVGWSGG